MKKFENKKTLIPILAISIIAIMFIPMLYSSIYLGAFWDPYGKLDKVPVAFVNLDKPVTKDGKTFAIGKDLKKNLKDNKKVSWKFVSKDEAKNGVKGTSYYALVEIPKNFSEKISNSQNGDFKTPSIIYEANKGKNFVFSQISERVAESIRLDVSSSIQKEVSKALVDNLYDVKVSIGNADDGANKIKDGTKKLVEGSKTLSDGVNSAANGSTQLKSGLTTLTTGQTNVVTGVSSLITGLNTFKTSITQSNPKIPDLVKGAATLASSGKTVEEGTTELDTAISSLAAGADQIKTVGDNISALYTSLEQEKKVIEESNITEDNKKILFGIIDGMKKLNDAKISDKSTAIKTGTASAQKKLESLKSLSGGAKKVSDGVNSLVSGLSESQTNAAKGLDQLITGAKGIQTGNSKILTGINTVSEKTGTLSSGLTKLNEGSSSLNTGLSDSDKGISKLSDGLSSGYKKLNGNLKFKSNDMASFISNPVKIENRSINDVKYYGEGLAPYFVSLSLWLGAMFINLILSLTKKFKLIENKFLNGFIGRFLMGFSIAMIQAFILSLVLVEGLKIDVTSIASFYLTNLFISLVFFSVMYGVSHAIGIIGTPIMFVIFLLQLSSSGGTFPIETAPKFYKVVGSVFPMTYSISTLRMIIAGINSSVLQKNITIMVGFMLGFLIGGIIIKTIINFIKNNKLTFKVKGIITARD